MRRIGRSRVSGFALSIAETILRTTNLWACTCSRLVRMAAGSLGVMTGQRRGGTYR
ncbi:hypothetical protein Afil01_66010 [Actinorhabdospora filicis]|uniref:Uncharacterized protein n=1 Tax=Actinorhabdospora filicis TaxID=1785913 RepID=A0A9W6SRX8_9ACTN|nr:hypothetical protein Afil01_66010 [Actinorhabdospora filicis]